MTSPSPTAQRILDAAERRVRAAGYTALSIRDLAADIGIKSASLYHHFPTKERLVAGVADRYVRRFLDRVAGAGDGPARIAAYRDAFRAALRTDGHVCLCGVLGAESAGLPEAVRAETRRFFRETLAHLADGLRGITADPEADAMAILARLEGAMILARALDDLEVFDRATIGLERMAGAPPPDARTQTRA